MLFAAAAAAAMLLGQNYSEHVAPVLFEYCVSCHRSGESAPFSLLTYEDARRHAAQIVKVTKSRYMPPWPPEPGFGDFAGARCLTGAQIAMLEAWSKNGAPAGDLSRAPAAPKFTPGWQLGEPDLVLRIPQAYDLAPEGGDVFRNFILPVDLPKTRYIRAIELRPSNKRVVHHANLVVDRTRSLRVRDGADGKPGFAGMDVETESGDEFVPDSHFLLWKPGTVPQPEPPGMPWRLDPGTDLILNLHLQPSGKPERVDAVAGLYFADKPPTRFPMLLQLEHDGAIDVPPGSRDFAVTDQLKLPVSIELLAIYPHAHYIGKKIEVWAILPGGARVELLRINDWDINWQASYTYRKPVALPAGATVFMRITYDNSAANPRNPSRPPMRVKAGNRSQDEMGHVWLQVLTAQPEQRLDLHRAAMRRRLEKYPADFLAHYNLGSALQALDGHEAEALTLFEGAVRIRPTSATAQNALGGQLLAMGRLDAAIATFRKALQIDPLYGVSRYNLGQALAMKGDVAAALPELRQYLKEKPRDGRAQYTTGGILASAGRIAEAVPYFRVASELAPDAAEIHADLGAALAITGDVAGAVKAFERAVSLNPNDATSRSNLEKARAELRQKK